MTEVLNLTAYYPLLAQCPLADLTSMIKVPEYAVMSHFVISVRTVLSAGLSDKQLLQPAVDALELGSDRELQRSLSRFVAHILYMVNFSAGDIQMHRERFEV